MKIQICDASELRIHPKAQRALTAHGVNKIVKDFNPDAIGVIHAVPRGDKLLVVDGQHRLAAIKTLKTPMKVRVEVHADVTDDAGACRLFDQLNQRSNVAAFDRYKVRVTGGYEDEVAADRIVRMSGLNVAKTSAHGHVSGVDALMISYRMDAGESLQKSLRTMLNAWGRKAALEGKLIRGMSSVFARYNGKVDEQRMARTLSRYPGSSVAIINDARGLQRFAGGSLPRNIASVIVKEYNKRGGRGDRLPAFD